MKDIQEICNQYNINLIKIRKGDQYCISNGEDTYTNRSFVVGGDEIIIGIYDEEDLLIASFFHELGHIVNSKVKGFFNSEEDAWNIGFKLAKENGYTFSEKTYKWAKEQLLTYSL